MDLKEFSLKNAKISSRKANDVTHLLRGKSVKEAKRNLKFNNKKASGLWLKLLNSGSDYFEKENIENVCVKEVYTGPATTLKKSRFGGRGRVKPIKKRRANLYIKLGSKDSDK